MPEVSRGAVAPAVLACGQTVASFCSDIRIRIEKTNYWPLSNVQHDTIDRERIRLKARLAVLFSACFMVSEREERE